MRLSLFSHSPIAGTACMIPSCFGIATGDFNSDGVEDFAVALVDKSQLENVFALVVFNGPLKPGAQQPAFMEAGRAFTGQGLSFGPPRPKPYRLIMGAFESEGGVLQPKGKTYTWDIEP